MLDHVITLAQEITGLQNQLRMKMDELDNLISRGQPKKPGRKVSAGHTVKKIIQGKKSKKSKARRLPKQDTTRRPWERKARPGMKRRSPMKLDQILVHIPAFLREGPNTMNQIHHALNVKTDRCKEALKMLEDRGVIEKFDGKKADPNGKKYLRELWRLKQ